MVYWEKFLTKDRTVALIVDDYDIRIVRTPRGGMPGGVLFSINTYPLDPEKYLDDVCYHEQTVFD